MSQLELYGTLTSPYVRRVRIVAQELRVKTQFIDTSTDEGQAALREVTPLWKVPAARIEGHVVFDSLVINQVLLEQLGFGPMRRHDPRDLETRNVLTVIDGALDSLINIMYLQRNGVQRTETPYLQKQFDRARESMRWLEQKIETGAISEVSFGLPEIHWLTTLHWIRFRDAYPIDDHPALTAWGAQFADRPSIADTMPTE